MHASRWLTLWDGKRLSGFLQRVLTGSFGLGLFLGVVAVSLWQQWSLTFGHDPRLMLAMTAVLSVSFWFGQRWDVAADHHRCAQRMSSAIICLALWSVLHPYWLDVLTILMSRIPVIWLTYNSINVIFCTLLATAGMMIPAVLWTVVFQQQIRQVSVDHASQGLQDAVPQTKGLSAPMLLLKTGIKVPGVRGDDLRPSCVLMHCGVASGLILNSLVLSPMIGVFVPTIIAAAIATCLSGWQYYVLGKSVARRAAEASPDQSSIEDSTVSRPRPRHESIWLSWCAAGFAGVLLACCLRLVNQLMPLGAFVLPAEIAGIFAGMAGGLIFIRCFRRVQDWVGPAGLLAATATGLIFCFQPLLVDLSLWMNSSLTTVSWLLLGRVLLLTLVAFPFGIAISWISVPRNQPAHTFLEIVPWGSPFVAGFGAATFLLAGLVGMVPMLTCGSCFLLAAVGIRHLRNYGSSPRFMTGLFLTCVGGISLIWPISQFSDSTSRTAKLLYSSPVFAAYRSGWQTKHLAALDDLRMIESLGGNNGPLTLWKGRVAELYVREAGIPRSIVSTNPTILPQFAPEVLQAVYSLVLSDRPGRVLVLGLSGGVALSTCLQFPIREAVCVEEDASVVSLVRGRLAQETGVDPLADDRVSLQRISPELALMARHSNPFDVIISSPRSSSLTSGGPAFTQEFYTRAAQQLTERGLFCQRFECIDYGPEPLQIVLKSMRQAFRQVIAVETGFGDFLLLGANTDDVFIPADLAMRLEVPHVRRLLERCGLDWSTLLSLSVYDHEALGEICAESQAPANSIFHGLLAARSPREVMRWANKQQQLQALLTTARLTRAPFSREDENHQNGPADETKGSRRSRFVEWLGESMTPELFRRMDEVVAQQKLVHDHPDSHWRDYRIVLRRELQERPRSALLQIKAIDEGQGLHPEDRRRCNYFKALGQVAHRDKPPRAQIAAVERFLEPFDPLLSYFAHQEIAELLSRAEEDVALELAYRMHVIFFAPAADSSVRNVASAIRTLTQHPEAIPNDSDRYDALNGLIQTLRSRWEARQNVPQSSSQRILEDVDQTLVAVEHSITALNELAATAGLSEQQWEIRKQVIERLLLRPLRSYRIEVQTRQKKGQAQAQALLQDL